MRVFLGVCVCASQGVYICMSSCGFIWCLCVCVSQRLCIYMMCIYQSTCEPLFGVCESVSKYVFANIPSCQHPCHHLCQHLCQHLCHHLCHHLCQHLCHHLCQHLCHHVSIYVSNYAILYVSIYVGIYVFRPRPLSRYPDLEIPTKFRTHCRPSVARNEPQLLDPGDSLDDPHQSSSGAVGSFSSDPTVASREKVS